MASLTSTEAPLIPKSVLFGNPEITDPRISPDGKQIGWLAPDDGVLNVWVAPLEKGVKGGRPVTHDRDRGVMSWRWIPDSRRVVFLQDKDGDENWRLYGVDLDSGEETNYTPFENVAVRIIRTSHRKPDEMVLAINKDRPEIHDLYTLNLESGELELTVKNRGDIGAFYCDFDLNLRVGVALRDDGGTDVVLWDDKKEEFTPFFSWSLEEAMNSSVACVSGDGRRCFAIDSRRSDKGQLVEIDLESGDITTLASDDDADIVELLLDTERDRVLAYEVEKDTNEWYGLDDKTSAILNRIEQLAPGCIESVSQSLDQNHWVVGINSSDRPLRWFHYIVEDDASELLAVSRPELEQYQLAEMEPFDYTARDGMKIHGYLTFPPGSDRKNVPTVLAVHGGPWVRDSWGYRPEVQLLANRGYLVIQVNYRGSTGYGKEFINAGNKEWGRKMHHDLIDAVQWAIEKGYTDRDRVAIFGGSYGGYSALVGATMTPDEFACSVAFVGPSNLITFINSIPPYWKPQQSTLFERVGHPERDKDLLMERSPLTHVNNISVPMLILHGANDPRVKQAESEQIVSAMKENGIDHEYILFPDEGHGCTKPENRMKLFDATERFLAEHIGGRCEDS